MSRDAMFFMPSPEGVEAPAWFMNAWGSLGTSLDQAFRTIGGWTSDPSQTIIEVQDAGALTLQEISDYLPISGTLRPFHGSWAAAATMRGWAICDGSNGTPKIHPALGDASPIQRMVRATAYGVNSGTTAGTECHCHATCTASGAAGGHNHALAADCACTTCDCHCHVLSCGCACTTCDNHCHTIDCDCVTTCCNGCHYHALNPGCACTCTDGCHCHAPGTLYTAQSTCADTTCSAGTDHCFTFSVHCHAVCGCTDYNTHCHSVQGATCCDSNSCHKHGVCGATCCACECHCHGVQGSTCYNCHRHCLCGTTCNVGTHSHALSSKNTSCNAHLPQVIDVIWLMKL